MFIFYFGCYFKLAPHSEEIESYVYEYNLTGKDVIAIARFYPCHIPASVSLSIIVPSSDITWKSQNLTSDIPKQIPLGKTELFHLLSAD
jgi:hypothetical protein